MKSICVLAGVFLIAGCATLTEQELEAREYRNLDWRNAFVDYRQRCIHQGGRVLIDARGGHVDREGVPSRGDYYTCSRRIERVARGN